MNGTAPRKQNYHIDHAGPVVVDEGHEMVQLELCPAKPDYVTPDGIDVWIERKGQKTRFLDACGNQVGPLHRNLAPAIVWARTKRWRNPAMPEWFNDRAIAEATRAR